jgi:hypothetical protein
VTANSLIRYRSRVFEQKPALARLIDYPVMGEREDLSRRAQVTVYPQVAVFHRLGCRLRVCRVDAAQEVQPARHCRRHFDHHIGRLVRVTASLADTMGRLDVPVSACFSANAICSSVCLVVFMSQLLARRLYRAGKLSLKLDEKTAGRHWYNAGAYFEAL